MTNFQKVFAIFNFILYNIGVTIGDSNLFFPEVLCDDSKS